MLSPIQGSTSRLEWHRKTIPFWDFMDGMKLSPWGQFAWSVVFIFLWAFFFSYFFFFTQLDVFFSWASLLIFFWGGPPLTPYYFLATPTYPSNLPTGLPPTNPSTSLLLLSASFPPFPLTSIPSACHTQCFRNKDNLSLHKGLAHKALSFHNFKSLKKGLSGAWRGVNRGGAWECAKARTLNTYRDGDLEGEQKTFSDFFFSNYVVAPRGLGCDVFFFMFRATSTRETTTMSVRSLSLSYFKS